MKSAQKLEKITEVVRSEVQLFQTAIEQNQTKQLGEQGTEFVFSC